VSRTESACIERKHRENKTTYSRLSFSSGLFLSRDFARSPFMQFIRSLNVRFSQR
jgi:hypothetical protein